MTDRVPVYWLAKEGVCTRCRWDEQIVEDMIGGWQKAPATLPRFEHFDVHTFFGRDIPKAVVVFPAGNHDSEDLGWLNDQLDHVERLILFITSDEGSHFPVEKIRHAHMRLWVQTPRPELYRLYPQGTEFFGFGSGRAWTDTTPREKTIPLFFSGQKTHERRDSAIANSHRVAGAEVHSTDGFAKGMERQDYLRKMRSAQVVPCPAGAETNDSFRFYEALEMGAVPIPDAKRSDGGGGGYWDMVAPLFPVRPIVDWRTLPSKMKEYRGKDILCHWWWHNHRRQMVRRLAQQVTEMFDLEPDPLTVIIPTSSIPSHPSTDIIDATIRSVRERTDAEIIIMADGLRPELEHRREEYDDYLRRILMLSENHWWNVTPIIYHEHLHQAEMTRRTLMEVDSAYIMFVEHDTPLVGEIDMDAVIDTMKRESINLMRFYHESAIHPGHEWLMVGPAEDGFRRTMQWSQRPHIARKVFYTNRVLAPYFSTTARVMIEDVMFGVLDHAWRVTGEESWGHWRLAIWHPEGSIQRSDHLDGRGEDSKFETEFRYRYPGNRTPAGAPNPKVGKT